jgi:hypothetical protein
MQKGDFEVHRPFGENNVTRKEITMDVFWFIPVLLAVIIGIWIFYVRMMRAGGDGVRKEGKTLVDKDDRGLPPPF